MRDSPSLEASPSIGVLRRALEYPVESAGLLAAASVAWLWTIERMSGMDPGPGTGLGTLGWFIVSWVLMMAAMMLPSYAPTLATYATVTRTRRPDRLLLFASGYLLAWLAAGLLAYGFFELGRSLLAPDLAWARGGQWLSSGVIALAAVYELLPLKRGCLARCRGHFAESVRPPERRLAALGAGGRSGAWCIGCSWALMAALFALGVMNLTWMALIAALVTLQKLGPSPPATRLATAIVLAALATFVVLAPHDVPGLVFSNSMYPMNAMGG